MQARNIHFRHRSNCILKSTKYIQKQENKDTINVGMACQKEWKQGRRNIKLKESIQNSIPTSF